MEEKKDDGSAAPKAEADSLQIYGRIRKIMPWEPDKKGIKWNKENIEAVVRNQTQRYKFSRVYDPSQDNRACFDDICKPMAKQVLDGFNAVLIAYGQTGSGKTHSLLGKPKRNVLGILPMVIEFFLNCPDTKVTLGAVEAFGHHVNRIELFDLFNPNCQSKNWSEKYSKTSLAEKEMVFVSPKDATHGNILVSQAQQASHYAPTGKNPESSRGHISFIVRVVQEKKETCQMLESYFIIVDLAGSEGETAFTPAFKAKVDPSTLMARRLEAGVINTGLSQLQIIFNELKVKGRLSKMIGVGLRRVLHPYINNKCILSVLFCISPSAVNVRSTVSTLKFAVQAGMVSVKPIKESVITNWALLVKGLKEMMGALNKDIDDRDKTIARQEMEINQLIDELEKAKANPGQSIPPTPSRRKAHTRARSTLPMNLEKMIDDADNNEDENEGFDAKDRADIDEFEIDKEVDKGLAQQRGEKEAVAAVVGCEREELIRKNSIIFTSLAGLDNIVQSLTLPRGSTRGNMFGSISRNLDKALELETMNKAKNNEITINLEQDHMETDGMDRATLAERCEVLESMLEAEKAMNASYLYSQQVIIDHLAETNEGLLQFFRVKLKLLESAPGGKKKKNKKKKKVTTKGK